MHNPRRSELLHWIERMRLEGVNMGTREGLGRHELSIPIADWWALRKADPDGLGRPQGSPEHQAALLKFISAPESLPYRVR